VERLTSAVESSCRTQTDIQAVLNRNESSPLIGQYIKHFALLCSFCGMPEVLADGCSSLLQLVVAANCCSWLLQLMVADICRTAGCSSTGISSEKDVYKCRRLLGSIMKVNEQEDLLLQLPHPDPGYPIHIRGSRLALIFLVQVKFSSRVLISKLCKKINKFGL
jgi:hypothetical protein